MEAMILIAVIFYISLCATGLNYVVKVRKIDDINARLKFMDATLGVIAIEQAAALIAVIAFYAIKFNSGVSLTVPNRWAITSAAIDFGGFVAVRTFWYFHSRKYYSKSKIPEIKEEKRRRMRDCFHYMPVILAAMAFVNFGFNLSVGGAIAYFA